MTLDAFFVPASGKHSGEVVGYGKGAAVRQQNCRAKCMASAQYGQQRTVARDRFGAPTAAAGVSSGAAPSLNIAPKLPVHR